MGRPPHGQVSVVVVENTDPAPLCGDINTVGASVVGQHIGHFADLMVVNHGAVAQVDGDHGGVGFATDEHHLVGGVERLTVRVIATGSGNAFCHRETDP